MLLGEIRMFAGTFPPRGWAFCHGQLLETGAYPQLYEILGSTYGGNGQETFALPNMQYRVPINQGKGPELTSRQLGDSVGEKEVILDIKNMPPHTHQLMASPAKATETDPSESTFLAQGKSSEDGGLTNIYSANPPNAWMADEAITNSYSHGKGSYQRLFITMSCQRINFIIAIEGEFPSTDAVPYFEEPLMGQVDLMPFTYSPRWWLPCDGRVLPISQYPALHSLLGTIYGGDGRSTFGIPDFSTSAPIGRYDWSSSKNNSSHINKGKTGSNALRRYGWVQHTHSLRVDSTTSTTNDPTGAVLGYGRFQRTTNNNVYASPDGPVFKQDGILSPDSIKPVGLASSRLRPSSKPKNMQPYLGLQFCICYEGVYPSKWGEGGGV